MYVGGKVRWLTKYQIPQSEMGKVWKLWKAYVCNSGTFIPQLYALQQTGLWIQCFLLYAFIQILIIYMANVYFKMVE
jgi:hypothetical protein